MTVQFEPTQAYSFMGAVFGSSKDMGDIIIHKSFDDPSNTGRPQAAIGSRLPDELITWELQNQRVNYYVAVCRFDYNRENRNSRKQKDVVTVPGVWLDLDIKDNAFHSVEEITKFLDAVLPASVLVDSGSGGQHAYWLLNKPLTDAPLGKELNIGWREYCTRIASNLLGREVKIDPVSDLSRVLRLPGTARFKDGLPPTPVRLLHHDGPRYTFENLVEIAPLPIKKEKIRSGTFEIEVHADRLTGYVNAALVGEVEAVLNATERNHALNSAAYSLARLAAHGREVLDRETVHDLLMDACVQNGLYDDASSGGPGGFEATFESGWSSGLENPRDLSGVRQLRDDPTGYKYTDHGNAERLAYYFSEEFRYLNDRDKWMMWDGRCWRIAMKGDLLSVANRVVQEIYREASTFTDQADRDRHTQWGKKTHSVAGSRAMVEYATGLNSLRSEASEFDRDMFLINVQNGVVDLRTGELLPHDAKYRITNIASVAYRPEAKAPRWSAMVERSVRSAAEVDPEIITYLQKVLGYMLVGQNPEEMIFFGVGEAQSGKSNIAQIMMSVLGSGYTRITSNKLLGKTREHHASEKFALVNKRFVYIDETSSMYGLDESAVKEVTGQTLEVREMRQQSIEVPVTWTIFLTTNHTPVVANWDDAISRRVVKIPFGPSIPIEERDASLKARLPVEEGEGIFAWLVEGAKMWYADWMSSGMATGLVPTLAIQAAKVEYETESDYEATFIEERCVMDPGGTALQSAVNDAYKKWCRGTGHKYQLKVLAEKLSALPGVSLTSRRWKGFRLMSALELEGFESDWRP